MRWKSWNCQHHHQVFPYLGVEVWCKIQHSRTILSRTILARNVFKHKSWSQKVCLNTFLSHIKRKLYVLCKDTKYPILKWKFVAIFRSRTMFGMQPRKVRLVTVQRVDNIRKSQRVEFPREMISFISVN